VLKKRARAKHLKVLSYPPSRRAGAVLIPGIRHAHAFDRLLHNAVDHDRLRETGSLKDRRYDVDVMMELIADASGILESGRQGHGHAIAGAAKMGGHLLGPLEGSTPRPGPAHRIVRIRLVRAPDVVELHVLFHCRKHAICDGHFTVGAIDRALGT